MLNPFGLNDKFTLIPDELNEEYEEESLIEDEEDNNIIETNVSEAILNDKNNSEIQIDNKVYYKSHVVSQIINSNSKLLSKRTTRVFGLSDDCFTVNEVDNLQSIDSDEQILISDILVTFLQHKTNEQFFLALVSIDKILYQNSLVNSLPIEFLKQSKFVCTMLELNNIDNENIIWIGKYGEQIANIDGALCCQLQNSISF
jgi:hypothetical protein